jgi:hypothetical protein
MLSFCVINYKSSVLVSSNKHKKSLFNFFPREDAVKLAVVCKLRFVPLRWHNFAIELAQHCQRIGTTVPSLWHKCILANAENIRCILAYPISFLH